MVKNAVEEVARTASFSARFATRTARIGPSGGVVVPKRLRSALVNGRSQAKAFPATNHVRLPWRSAAVASGSCAARPATSSIVAISTNDTARPSVPGTHDSRRCARRYWPPVERADCARDASLGSRGRLAGGWIEQQRPTGVTVLEVEQVVQ